MRRCGIKVATKEVAFKIVFDSVFSSGESATFVVELLDVEDDEVMAVLATHTYDDTNAGSGTEHVFKVLNYGPTPVGPKLTFSEHGFARLRLTFAAETGTSKGTKAGLHVEVTSSFWTSPLLNIGATEKQEWVIGK